MSLLTGIRSVIETKKENVHPRRKSVMTRIGRIGSGILQLFQNGHSTTTLIVIEDFPISAVTTAMETW
jgi:hypothetical protein